MNRWGNHEGGRERRQEGGSAGLLGGAEDEHICEAHANPWARPRMSKAIKHRVQPHGGDVRGGNCCARKMGRSERGGE